MMELPEPDENPVTFGELPLAVQAKVAGDGLDCKTIFVVPPEQTENNVVLVSTGVAVTVTRMVVKVFPVQPFAIGVTV